MKTNSLQISIPRLRPGSLAAVMLLGAILALHAETAPERSKPAPGPTNVVVAKSAPAPASTNIAPAQSAPSAFPHVTITADDDDASDTSSSRGSGMSGNGLANPALEALLIPIVAIVATFGTPILIVFFVCYFKFRRRRENLVLAQEYLNKGLPVPPQLLDESQGTVDYSGSPESPSRCKSDLRRGFQLTFIGLGVTLALYVSNSHSRDWAWGLIPLVIGLGYLLSGWVEGRQQKPISDSRPIPQPPKSPL